MPDARTSRRLTTLDGVLALAAIGVLVAIAWFSLGTPPPGPVVSNIDKVEHTLAYVALALVWLLLLVWCPKRGDGRWPNAIAVIAILIGAIAYGGLIEILQGAYFDRQGDLVDLVADSIGAGVGWLIWRTARAREHTRLGRRRRLRSPAP